MTVARHTLFQDYPFVGRIRQWDDAKQVGRITGLESSRTHVVWAPTRNRFGNSGECTEENLVGKLCAFHAVATPSKKWAADGQVVHWVLEDDVIEPLTSYDAVRREAIGDWGIAELSDALGQYWYLLKCAGRDRRPRLEADVPLLQRVEAALANPESLEAYIHLLVERARSPYFGLDSDGKQRLIAQGLRRIEGDLQHLLSTTASVKLIEQTCWEVSLDAGPPLRAMIEARCIAIDIEASRNQGEIFQIGISSVHGDRMLFNKDGPQGDLSAAVRELEDLSSRFWIIGHNIHGWDIPILAEHGFRPPADAMVWDTLLCSWMLQPWAGRHALIDSERAHHAVEDARSAFELFKKQLRSLDNDHIGQLLSLARGEGSPLDVVAAALPTIPSREFPSEPDFLERKTYLQAGRALIPESRVSEYFWVPNVTYSWPEGHVAAEDDCLLPSDFPVQCGRAQLPLPARVVEAVVRDANQRNVTVLRRMIPEWLHHHLPEPVAARVRGGSSGGAMEIRDSTSSTVPLEVSTYESLWALIEGERREILQSDSWLRVHPDEGRLSLVNELKRITDSDVEGAFPDLRASPSTYELYEVVRRDALAGLVSEVEAQSEYFLEFDPVRQRTSRAPWILLRSASRMLAFEGDGAKTRAPLVRLPSWQDPSGGDQGLADSIWPTSANRLAYWEDALSRVLSIDAVTPKGVVLLLLVSHQEEVEPLRSLFCQLELTCDTVDMRPLRHLEAIRKRGYRFAIDVVDRGKYWINAASALGIEVDVVIESLPLARWVMLLDAEERQPESIGVEAATDSSDERLSEESAGTGEADDAEESSGSEEESQETDGGPDRRLRKVRLRRENIVAAVNRFCGPWLRTVLGDSGAQCHPLVVDSRLDDVGERLVGVAQGVPILREDLHDQTRDLLFSVREEFGSPERKPAPEDYESYRAFLKQNWGHDDFRESQRDAIRAIIKNDRDVLVRLPTGEGKSVLFQIPALLRGAHTRRLTLVITPLRALMADQTRALWMKGFNESVDYLSADRDPWVINEVFQGILDNRITLLFVAPERFRSKRFRDALDRRHRHDEGFEYLVVDEVHCVSQWGYEFRPDYLWAMSELQRCYRNRENGPFSNLIMLSATVTEAVRQDVERSAGVVEDKYEVLPPGMRHPIQDFIRIDTEDVDVALYGENLLSSRLGRIESVIEAADTKKSAIIVFVTRRRHAEEAVEWLSSNGRVGERVRIRCFHAGLPPSERLEVYDELRDRKASVLVATKAFGMGMDIPHIHWCIHLAPPAYLEDYLQEVGRTGRGPQDRAEAGLDRVECRLLYDRTDFSKNLELLQSSKLTVPDLVSLWDTIRERTQILAGSDLRVCVLSTDGTGELNGDRLRKALYWVERSGRIAIEGYLPNIIAISLNRERLEEKAKAADREARVARCLLGLYGGGTVTPMRTADSAESPEGSSHGVLGSVLAAARNVLGFLFAGWPAGRPQNEESTEPEVKPAPSVGGDRAEVSVEAVWLRSGLPRIDDVFSALAELERDECIHFVRQIEFGRGRLFERQTTMWGWVERALDNILVATSGTGRECDPAELVEGLDLPDEQALRRWWNQDRIDGARKRCLRGAMKVCSNAGIHVRETVSDEGRLVYKYALPQEQLRRVRDSAKGTLRLARSLADNLANQDGDTASLHLSQLFALQDRRVDLKALQAAIRLLENIGVHHTDQPLLPFSYILTVTAEKPMSTVLTPDEESRDRELFDELERVNDLAECRANAMELFALLPDEARREFIDAYFRATDAQSLQKLLEESVGMVDEERLGPDDTLEALLQKVRRQAIEEELSALSPQQRAVCEVPYVQNILVNAGPGAGKTRVLLMRAAHLVNKQGLRPNQILILAFNRAVVHEIRSRLKALFDKLGYGAYVRRLQVYTFHAFARLKSRDLGWGERLDEAALNRSLHEFSNRCHEDEAFCDRVTSGVKAILVDEFQDMNEDFYQLLNALRRSSGAGMMVIGDDDQDILRWNRVGWEKEQKTCSRKEAVEYFGAFRSETEPIEMQLTVNYRSAASIVKRSQDLISTMLTGLSGRSKAESLVAHATSSGEVVEKLESGRVLGVIDDISKRDESTAILCRTNRQVLAVFESLRDRFPHARIQSQDRIDPAKTRHVATWLDTCRAHSDLEPDAPLVDVLDGESLFERLRSKFAKAGIPESGQREYEEVLEFLWVATLSENPRAKVSDHIDFVQELKDDDLTRMMRSAGGGARDLVISTIHKVKGLEFDNVILRASTDSFPLNGDDLHGACAEEIRLFYVGMTRAKRYLAFEWGEREKAWGKKRQQYPSPDNGKTGYLVGRPGEVHLSWPGYATTDESLQAYITHKVAVGDSLTCHGSELKHRGRTVARLASSAGSAGSNAALRVSAVFRQLIGPEIAKPEFWPKIAGRWKERGWLYSVLVAGRL